MRDSVFDETLSEVGASWRTFKVVATNFLGNLKQKNHEPLVQELLSA
jgi:hypothetical protein